MPVLTDPRQIVSPLPASLMKEIPDGTRLPIDRSSATKPSKPREGNPNALPAESRAETRKQEAETGEKSGTSSGAIATVKGREIRDKLYPEKRLVECWSLNNSVEHYGELEPMLHETKELIKQEVLEWAKLDREAYIRASEL
jgi:hypothetical protein